MAAIDLYKPCPGGCGKKIKFCCSRDLVHELERVIRMIEGEQYRAVRDKLAQLLVKYPGRNCLLALRVEVETLSRDLDAAHQAIQEFLEASPENPLALGYDAMIRIGKETTQASVERMQLALQHCEGEAPPPFIGMLERLGRQLIQENSIASGMAHLRLAQSMYADTDEDLDVTILTLEREPQFALPLRPEYNLPAAPETKSWRHEYKMVLDDVGRGAWSAAAERLDQMTLRVLDQPILMRAMALVNMWLGHGTAAVKAFRKYAAMHGVELRQAVWAETLAQLLDTDLQPEMVDLVQFRYEISDLEQLLETLRTHLRFQPKRSTQDESEPVPPKATYYLLSQPRMEPQEGAEVRPEDVPMAIGTLRIYGRQTDREAQCEFIVIRDDTFTSAVNGLMEAVGGHLRDSPEEQVINQIPRETAALASVAVFPKLESVQQRQALIAAQRGLLYRTKWIDVPNASFGGKTPREASQDPALQRAVLAAIKVMEYTLAEALRFDFNLLREDLSLPVDGPVHVADVEPGELSILDLPYVVPDELENVDLLFLFVEARRYRVLPAVHSLGLEIVNRQDQFSEQDLDIVDIYAALANSTTDLDASLQWINKARQKVVAGGGSPAQWLVLELAVRMEREEASEAERIMRELTMRHKDEPGIMRMVAQVLSRFGVLDQQAMQSGPMPPSVPTAASPDTGIWTPDGGQPVEQSSAPSAESGGSKLWLPDSQD